MYIHSYLCKCNTCYSHFLYVCMRFISKFVHGLLYLVLPIVLVLGPASWAHAKSQSSTSKFETQMTKATHTLAQALVKQSPKNTLNTVAVLPFKALDKESKKLNLTAALSELFSNKLSAQSGIITVERAGIDRIISEIKRAQKGEISAKTAAQAGKLMGARYVVLGSISTLGTEIQMAIRLVVSETGVIAKAVTLQAPRGRFVAFHKDVVVTRTRSGSIFRSMLLPGWGQIYNQDTYKGWITASLTLGALTVAGIYGVMGSQAETKYQENTQETVPQRALANQYYRNTRMALTVAGVLWGYAVIDAIITGKSSQQVDLKGWATPEGGGMVWQHSF